MNEQIQEEKAAKVDRLIVAGNVLEDNGDVSGALATYHEARQIDPDSPRAHLNYGNALLAMAMLDEAIAAYHAALRLDPRYAPAHANLARVLVLQKQYAEAETHYSAAVDANPEFSDGYAGLGCVLEELERPVEAIQAYMTALEIRPENAGASFNLGRLLLRVRQFDEAAEYLERSLRLEPNNPAGEAWLGKALVETGSLYEGVQHMRKGSELAPDDPHLQSMLLFTLNYLPDLANETLFESHRRFGQRFCDKLTPSRLRHVNVATPDRVLRIGYVSGDFRDHPVSRFIEPVITAHDRSRYEVHCFHNFEGEDDAHTQRLKNSSDRWHRIIGLDDDAAADLIRQLRIDILVDLSGHTDRNRLLVFARKPAPVQATWLGYLGTTGVKAMDYRICDVFTDPPGMTEQLHVEKLARLPLGQWCHAPYDAVLHPLDLPPMSRNGYPTLGSFNNSPKINGQVIALWGKILAEIPQARLRIAGLSSNRARSIMLSGLTQSGVEASRIEFLPRTGFHDYLSAIREVDIVLDPFPYNGGTTTVDALAMGTPVVALAGNRSVSRGGVSLLSTVGLTNLIAADLDDYLGIVKRLVGDPASLQEMRKTLRAKFERSVLQDSRVFTNQLEALYREMWRAWCEQ